MLIFQTNSKHKKVPYNRYVFPCDLIVCIHQSLPSQGKRGTPLAQAETSILNSHILADMLKVLNLPHPDISIFQLHAKEHDIYINLI